MARRAVLNVLFACSCAKLCLKRGQNLIASHLHTTINHIFYMIGRLFPFPLYLAAPFKEMPSLHLRVHNFLRRLKWHMSLVPAAESDWCSSQLRISTQGLIELFILTPFFVRLPAVLRRPPPDVWNSLWTLFDHMQIAPPIYIQPQKLRRRHHLSSHLFLTCCRCASPRKTNGECAVAFSTWLFFLLSAL